jgi:hypothetical protein
MLLCWGTVFKPADLRARTFIFSVIVKFESSERRLMAGNANLFLFLAVCAWLALERKQP